MATCENHVSHGISMGSVRRMQFIDMRNMAHKADSLISIVKVLYTFDYENKINHLARWPEDLTIQKFVLENGTIVGVVELQTCLQAIIKASPELLTKTNQDYTIYAHDFSECDYPLVGQGLLSKVLPLATSSVTSSSSRLTQLIAGRVYNDIHGIFTSGVKEAMEVKMRLVPVPLTIQPREMEAPCTCKDSNQNSTNAMNSTEWSSLMLAGSSSAAKIMGLDESFGSDMCINNHLSLQLQEQPQSATQHEMRTKKKSENDSSDDLSTSRKPIKVSRPSSRISSKRLRGHKAIGSIMGENLSSVEEGTDGEGASVQKKRAKVQKAQWNTNSAIGQNSDSLRVAAGTSGSLRLLRPIAMTPCNGNSNVQHHEDISRTPTPTPYVSERQKNTCTKPRLKLRIRRNSNFSEDSSRLTERGEELLQYSTESLDASSERHKSPFDTETPPGMTSSPPLMKARTPSRIRSSPPCPSSPSLPQLPRLDIGPACRSTRSVSRENDDALPEVKHTENKAGIKTGLKKRRHSLVSKASQKSSKNDFTSEKVHAGPIDLSANQILFAQEQKLPQSALPRNDSIMSDDGQMLSLSAKENCTLYQKAMPQQQPFINMKQRPEEPIVMGSGSTLGVSAPLGAQTGIQNRACAPSNDPRSFSMVPASDPIMPATSQLSCNSSRTLLPAEKPVSKVLSMSSFINLQTTSVGQAPATMSQSVSKREMIRQKLETAIDNGEMPPFCCNCGAIETPTWRKAWSKEIKGQPGYYEYSDEPGRVTAIIILTRDPEGKPTSYNLVKKYLGEDESQDDYNEYLLCNQSEACGIWMSKYKTSRPEERWESNSERSSRAEPKKRPTQRLSRPKKNQLLSFPPPHSEASGYLASDTICASNETNECTEGSSSLEATKNTETLSNLANPLGSKVRKDSNVKLVSSNVPKITPSASLRTNQTNEVQGASMNEGGGQLGDMRQRLSSPSWQVEDVTPNVSLDKIRADAFPKERNGNSPELIANQIPNHENCEQVAIDRDTEAKILQLFEEDLNQEDTPRPSTPGPRFTELDLSPTPTRLSPSHGRVRDGKSISIDLVKSVMPVHEINGSPRCVAQRLESDSVSGSPFTARMNELICETKRNHLPESNIEYDISLPALSDAASTLDMNLNFSLEEFFSTDILNVNSSPPLELNFHDEGLPDSVTGMSWRDLNCFIYEDVQINPEIKQEAPSSATTTVTTSGVAAPPTATTS